MDKKEFFISYNKVDKEIAEWIAWVLEDAGYSTVIQAWDFRAGSNFIIEMQKASVHCNRTIAVFSQAYMDALFTHPEWAAAFSNDPTGADRKLIPVGLRILKSQECLGTLCISILWGLRKKMRKKSCLMRLNVL